MMKNIREFHEDDLPQLTLLINLHISMIIPEWGLPSAYIRSHLDAHPEQYVIDPWVIERKTLLAFDGEKLVAAGHLLRYGIDEKVSDNYKNTGDIAWFVAYPDAMSEARDLLEACVKQMREWGLDSISAWDSGLPIPVTMGIYDKWPHLAKLFREAGFQPKPERQEAIWGGKIVLPFGVNKTLPQTIASQYANGKITILSVATGERIAFANVTAELTMNGKRPLLKDWGELEEIWVHENWRRMGIASFMLKITVSYLMKSGCKHIVFAVTIDDEMAGAGDFYRSMGWDMISRCEDGWELLMPQAE